VRSHGGALGASRLRQNLKTRGVDRRVDRRATGAGRLPDELERARVVWRRKFPAAPADAREWARQARFLKVAASPATSSAAC
jgi:regulatory protein